MNTTERRSSSAFFSRMLYIALIALLVISIGSSVFYVYLAAYEHSRPSFAIKKYIEGLKMNDVVDMSKELVDGLDMKVQSRQECYEKIFTGIKNGQFVKNVRESNAYTTSYVIMDNGIAVENVVLTPGKKDPFNFIPWAVAETKILDSSLFSRVRVTVPKGYSVKLNGENISAAAVADPAAHYSILEGFYELRDNLPTLVSYDTGEFIGKANLEVFDGNGRKVTEAEYSEDVISDNCSDEKKLQVQEFMTEFIRRYVSYKSSASHTAAYDMGQTAALCVPDSDMAERLKLALGGLQYASSLGDTLEDVTLIRCMDLGDGSLACDVSYTVTTVGSNAAHTTNTYFSRFLIVENKDSFLVEAESTY